MNILRLRMLLVSLVACASFVPSATSAWAGTAFVDGISDQSLPGWDSGFSGGPYFSGFFPSHWVASGHIRLARYVVQWNVMSPGYSGSRTIFEAWLKDAVGMGLTPDVGLTSYDGIYPSSPTVYKESLERLLTQAGAAGTPIRYVEAWNEPNNQGKEPAATAAHFTNSAYSACGEGYGCTVIAGDVEDSPSAGAYEKEYESQLSPTPTVWGLHAYYSVEEQSEIPYLNVVKNLPHEGAGDQVWITEVAARKCHDYNGELVERGEAGQAERARWLVDSLIKNRKPEHVFYYEFLLKERERPGCPAQTEDGALYAPSADPNAPDAPRPAASFIFAGKGVPSAYTGTAAVSATEPLATLAGSVYPGGLLDAKYHFEYGATASYGMYTTEEDAGSGGGEAPAGLSVAGLAPNTTYHYRLVAWNSEGAEELSYGGDGTFTTPAAPELLTPCGETPARGTPASGDGWRFAFGAGEESWIPFADCAGVPEG
jgi:hypothetical protein